MAVKPEYPKILTRKDWDKNKGLIAKYYGHTGIGDMMDDVQKQFDAVDWDKIDLTKRREKWTWGQDISIPNWEKIMKEAKDEITGKLADVSKALYELRDLALKIQKKFEDNSKIPSSSTKHVGKIATAADEFGVKLNKNSMSEGLVKMEKEFMDYVQKNFLDVWPTGLKKYMAKHTKVMEELRASPTVSKFDSACSGMLRDYTTALGNISKSHNKGFKVKNGPAAQKLFDALTPYANLQVKCKDNEEVKTHLDKMDKMCAAVKVFAGSL